MAWTVDKAFMCLDQASLDQNQTFWGLDQAPHGLAQASGRMDGWTDGWMARRMHRIHPCVLQDNPLGPLPKNGIVEFQIQKHQGC